MTSRHDYNYCSNNGTDKDPTADTALCQNNRLGICQRATKALNTYLKRRNLKLVGVEIWDKETNRTYGLNDME